MNRPATRSRGGRGARRGNEARSQPPPPRRPAPSEGPAQAPHYASGPDQDAHQATAASPEPAQDARYDVDARNDSGYDAATESVRYSTGQPIGGYGHPAQSVSHEAAQYDADAYAALGQDARFGADQRNGGSYAEPAQSAGDPSNRKVGREARYGAEKRRSGAYGEAGRNTRSRHDGGPSDERAQGGRRPDDRRGRGGNSGEDRAGRPRAKRKLSARAYFGWAAGLAVLLVVGLAALLVGTHDTRAKGRSSDAGAGQAAANGVTPSTYSSSPSARAYAGIEKRTSDAAPLTQAEAFPADAATIEVSQKIKLTLRGKELGGDCTAAVWGADTAKALRRAGCTQTARTLYADTTHGYALSVTVFNLVDASSANAVVDALGQGRGGGFVKPLPSDGPLATFGQNGYGAARGVAMGHFAVVAWAQRLAGSGDAASAAKDETLLSILIEGQKAPAPLNRAARTH
ncbi:hypothetical protein [Actinomadura gamaensis]|uniref:Uncharacterized protein n=1 Tax=Actinomadura gamaensis TaxID=1763541 RepID=A0ABV9TV71_9ACTN